ncbi:HLGFF motif protein [Neisseria animalis]|uniref:Uncharacterized protein n=1 Tax=Neisseria animalis TaxID=492 RepID=A0A5P3MRS0_NEIAN|nr:hypothetical protein [Neisseria animalis]QEY23339.1 hypothetical protein D0T90_01510 [Neisseria animalis]ROW33187.1 hypothetical protein CGZ60_00245 [Neisseria animalis]VEE08714.1 Uncharacterised protein [Neisseria animalis]
MNYFSIHTQTGDHLGFLVMAGDEEWQDQPQSGSFVVKLQREQPSSDRAAEAVLEPLQSVEAPLSWRIVKDRVELFDGEYNIGSIRNEYLTVGGQVLVLNDLTGTM